MINNIQELESQISYYATKYYLGEPEITDEQFDALVDQLRKLNPDSEVLKKTGWGFQVNGDKIKHQYGHVGSLDKAKSYKEIPDLFKNKTVYISPKLDGLSAVAYYDNGKLIKGITRGNGEYGKDITEKLKIIIGSEIDDKKFTGAVRGELIISESNWNQLQLKYKDLIAPRNFAAGIINRKDIDVDIKYIDFVVYKIIGQENKTTCINREAVLNWLKLNFKRYIPLYYYPILNESSWETFHKETFESFQKLGYGLDGLVLTLEDIQYLAHFEENRNLFDYIYTEIAFKFQSETATTIIKNIEWNLSRTQRLVPVANMNPVELSGAIIKKATCNNAKQVKDWGLGDGAEVVITRSNEVIPYIMQVIQEVDYDLPLNCPMCNELLVWDGVDLKCNNKNCLNLDYSDLQQWCEIIGETDGLQYTIMKQYLDHYKIATISDLYEEQTIVLADLNSRKLSITEEKIKLFFNKLYLDSINLEKALIGLNIPSLGEKTAKVICKNKALYTKLIEYGLYYETYSKENKQQLEYLLLDVVKEAKTEEILNQGRRLNHLKYIISRLLVSENILNEDIKYIAITGALQSMKRKDFEAYINKYGYELSTNLKKCIYLVNNDINSTSSKNKTAKELGIPIITEQEFLDILKKV